MVTTYSELQIFCPQTPFPQDPRGWGQKVKINFIRAWSSCIKRNHECSNMVAKLFPADPLSPTTLGNGVLKVKINFIRAWSCYIKKNHECSNMVANILPTDHHPPPPSILGAGVKRSKFNFLEYGHVAYQIK